MRNRVISTACLLVALTLSLMTAAGARAAALPLKATPPEIRIGERVTVTTTLPDEVVGNLRDVPTTGTLGDFVIVSQHADSAQIEWQVTTFETGERSLGPVVLGYVDASGEAQTIRSDVMPIQVQSVLPEDAQTAQVRPVKGPFTLPYPARNWLIALAVIAVAGLIAWLLWKRLKRPAPETIEAPVVLLEPDEEALRALAALETERAAENLGAKEFYSKVNYILRRYLERRHRFPALEMTSSEVLRVVEHVGWSGDLLMILQQEMDESDSAKFARYAPSLEKRRGSIERVRMMVEQTRPEPVTEPVAEGVV